MPAVPVLLSSLVNSLLQLCGRIECAQVQRWEEEVSVRECFLVQLGEQDVTVTRRSPETGCRDAILEGLHF